MITGVEYGRVNSLRGLSSDTKPTDVPNGSRFYEIDTGDTYIFDAEGVEWYKMPSSGGGPTPPGPTPTPGEVTRSDVNFYDYDGTLLHSYTKEEAQTLTALPENPSHTGLVAQGWNYTLEGMKAQLSDPGKCDIGQMYISYGGGTHIFITLNDARLSPILSICVNGRVYIDWGDGTPRDIVSGSSLTTDLEATHTYQSAGDYIISIFVSYGEFAFSNEDTHTLLRKNTTLNDNYVYANCVRSIWIGEGITSLDNAFCDSSCLETISIPNTVTSISDTSFQRCRNLKYITIPSSVTSIGNAAFNQCSCLDGISIPSSVTSIGQYTFNECTAIERLIIPNSVTSIGAGAFYFCPSLNHFIIPRSITSLGNSLFSNCYALEGITIPDSVTAIGGSTFSYCNNITSITIPNSVTSIGGAFQNCISLTAVSLPDTPYYNTIYSNMFSGCTALRNVTIHDSVISIGNYAFQDCCSLSSITIPAFVTSIGNNTFKNCYGLKEIHFLPSTPPTLANSNAFLNLPTDCTIYVPTGKLSTYKNKTNYPSASTYTYVEE